MDQDKASITNYRWSVCILQLLRCMGDRGWDFLLPVVLGATFRDSLLPSTSLETAQTLGSLILAPKVASWYAGLVEKRSAYVWMLVAELVAVTTLGLVLIYGSSLVQNGNVHLALPIFICGCLAAVDASISTVLSTVITKDWTAALAKGSAELAHMNSMVTICDLVTAALAPLLTGALVNVFGNLVAVALLLLWQLIAAVASAALTSWLNYVTTSEPESTSAKRTDILSTLRLWGELPREVRGAMASLVLLYCTVLGGGGAGLTSWLIQNQVSVTTLAAWRSGMQVIGFIGASLAPVLIRQLGVGVAARFSQTWQTCCVVIAAFGFFTQSTSILLLMIAASRIGLWCFDLAERQLVQEAVPAHQRTPLFAMEGSACHASQLLMLFISMSFSDPGQFGLLVGLSAMTTCVACACLNTAIQSSQTGSPHQLDNIPMQYFTGVSSVTKEHGQ